jgi:PPK2 family polyphosphate:nucleotide phosphotransferase
MDLLHHPTRAPHTLEKASCEQQLPHLRNTLADLQDVLFATKTHAVLIVLQGLDAAGKGGLIRKVFTAFNPAGCRVKNFQRPTAQELAQDYLWRVHAHMPPLGWVQILDRSHYEDVIIPKVLGQHTPAQSQRRLRQVLCFEEVLQDCGTLVLKFFLHVSAEEQWARLQERVHNPRKQWKYDPSDLQVFEQRNHYLEAYNWLLNETEKHPQAAQWNVIAADQNWHKEYAVATHVAQALQALNLVYPSHKITPPKPTV